MTKILLCTCKPHKFQDETYGQGNRVFNQCMGSDRKEWKCTICGNTKVVGGNPDEVSKKKGK